MLKVLLALATGAVGGGAFYLLHLPLAWMLGSMFATGLLSILGAPLSLPRWSRPPMTAVIGAVLGTSFTTAILVQAPQWIVPIVGVLLYVILAGACTYIYFRRFAGFDRPTAFFSGMPGGVVDMVILGSERGGDERTISLVHAARIFIVVMSIPFVIGLVTGDPVPRGSAAWTPLDVMTMEATGWFLVSMVVGSAAATVLRFPARFLTGPMLASALLHLAGVTDFVLPSIIIAAAQVVLGASIGCRFSGVERGLLLRIFGISLLANLLLIVIALGSAFAASKITGQSAEGLLLAYSPGGLAEMSLVAFSLHIDTSFVVLSHLLRVLLVVAGSSVVFDLLDRRHARRKPISPENDADG